ncbi:MAG: DUF4255 domain-containing protein [Syntrophomonas sp.]
MGSFNVVADVGNSIVKVLKDNLCPDIIPQPEMIGLGSPAEPGDFRLTLFLYNIIESGEFRHNEAVSISSTAVGYPPLSLDLYYLLTAHSASEISFRTADEHRILGKAMQALFDHAILRGPNLVGTLSEKNEEIRIVIDNLPFDLMMKLWTFPNVPYKLSVSYQVGPVYIDSTRTRPASRVLEAGSAKR